MEENQIKIDQEDLDLIKKIKEEYQHKVIEFGELKMMKLSINQQWNDLLKKEEELEKEVIEIQNREKSVTERIQNKYGSGNLNLDTGVFIKQ